ncbi:MAG TPA: lasso RiPP family leader peptide-containing protein [Vicinamibacterales bacterium]|nr:lasso RiPP family leader peptide-containing protein [Vicinamibacterales bacterium]
MDKAAKPEGTPASRDSRGKKPYAAPRLVEYGSVAKLTQTGGTTTIEPHGFKQPCL